MFMNKQWRLCAGPATSWVHYITSCNTQSKDPEDGRDQRPKHVELIGIINKPLLLDLVGVYEQTVKSMCGFGNIVGALHHKL